VKLRPEVARNRLLSWFSRDSVAADVLMSRAMEALRRPVLFLALFTPILLGLTRSAQQTGDALLYAYSIRTGVDLFHPHHLLYAPVVRALYLGLAPILGSASWDALAAAQLHGIAWATVAVTFFYLTARRVLDWPAAAVLGALGLLFTQGFWMLATHANSYVPALGCLSIVLWLLVRRDPTSIDRGELIVISLAWGLSVLYHQVNVLFAIPLLYYLRSASGRPLGRIAPAVLLPAGIVSAGAYAVVIAATRVEAGAGGLWRFPLDYALHPNPTWGTLENVSPSGVAALLTNQAWGLLALHRTLEGIFVALITALVVALGAWHARQVLRRARWSPFRMLLMLWVGTYLTFYLWWLPHHKPFFVLTTLPIVLLALMAFVDLAQSTAYFRVGRAAAAGALGVIVATTGLFHLGAVIRPLHTLQRPAYHEAESLNDLVDPSCYIMAPFEVAQALRYHFDRPRAAHARFPLLCTYQGKPIPAEFDIRKGECVVIAAQYLRPDRRLYGFDATGSPERWEAYLDWLFDFRSTPEGRRVESNDVRALRTATGADYIAILSSRQPVDGLRGFLESLDALGASVSVWSDRPFVRWLDDPDAAPPPGGSP